MFYHRQQAKVQQRVLIKHPKQFINHEHKEILRLEKACANLRKIAEEEEETLTQKEQAIKMREIELEE